MGEKQTGTCKWFNATKGFGFITPDDGGEDLFVHQTSIVCEGFRSLKDGEPVEFVVEQGHDGRARAVQVTGPNGASPQGSDRPDYGQGGGFGGGGGRGGGRGRGGYNQGYGGGGYDQGGYGGGGYQQSGYGGGGYGGQGGYQQGGGGYGGGGQQAYAGQGYNGGGGY